MGPKILAVRRRKVVKRQGGVGGVGVEASLFTSCVHVTGGIVVVVVVVIVVVVVVVIE